MRKFTFFLALMVAMVTTTFAQTPVLELTADEIGTAYPKQLSDEDAAKVFGLENMTVAVEVSTKSVSGRMSLFATSSPGTAANSDAKGTDSPYVGYGMNGSDVGYLASWRSGDRFTGKTSTGLPANSDGVIVTYVINRSSNSFRVFVNGVQERSWDNAHADGFMAAYEIATPGMVKADYADAQIYIGGAKNSAGDGEVFNGTITGIKVYDAALSNAEVAAISFEDPALLAAAQAEFNTAYTAAQAILDEAELVVNSTELPLQVDNADAAYYLWSNAPEPNEGDIKFLLDGSTGTYGGNDFFHTRWSAPIPAGPHYIEVDLGVDNELSEFAFSYSTRNFGGADDFPNVIQITGSNDKQNYNEIYTVSDLPASSNQNWSSDNIVATEAYRYIRFNVTKTQQSNRTYWHMSEFDIYTNSITVADKYNAVANEVANLKNLCDLHADNASYGIAKLTDAAAAINALVETVNAGVAVPVTFDIYALDDSMNPSPLEGTVSKLGYVVFAASDNNAVLAEAAEAPKVGIFDPAMGSVVAEASSIQFGDLLGNGMQLVAVQFDGFATPGTYKVYAPAGAFTVNGQPSEDIISAEFTIPAPVVKVFEVESVTPDDKEEVEAINKIEINFTETIALAIDNMGNFIPVNLVDENNNVIELAVSDDANVWSKVVLTPATPITAAGTYTLDLSQLQLNDGVCEGSYSWTVVEPVEPLTVVSVTPSEAVESFSSITIEFNKDIVVDWGTSNEGTGGTGTATGGTGGTDATVGVSSIKVKDANGGNVTTIWTSQAVVEGNTITFKLESAIAKSGEYSVEIPAGCIKSVDGEEYAGETFTFTVDAAPTMTSKATVNVDNALSDITVEFDSEIEFAAESDVTVLNVYVKDTETVAATITVANNAVINGKVLTLTLDEVLAPECTTKYTVEIPAGWIVKMGSDKAFTGKKLTYTVKIPFVIKNFTPESGLTVEALENIVIEYNENLTTYGEKTVLENVADNTQVEVTVTTNNNVATITPNSTVTSGTYKLVNLNYIVSYSSWAAPATLPEYTITVKEAATELPALEAVKFDRNPLETAINGQYKLQGVKIYFGEIVKKYTTDSTGDYGYILDAEGNEVATLNKCLGGNGTGNDFATPYASTAIETPGTYKVVVKSGVILSADGTKEYKGGEFEFTVAERAVEISPSPEDGLCWNETYEKVADFSEFVITVKYAKSDVVINNEVKATMKTGDTVYEATVTVEKSGTTQYITLAFDGEFAEGGYTIDVPAGLYTVDGVANAAYAQSTFTYSKPQLEITRDFDTWESYLDSKYSMPTAAMIKIANAESVEVDDTKVATIAVGENVYNSTVSYNYDDWSNAYYIELTFEDFSAEGFEFVKGDYIFTLPADLYTVNGVANEEAVKAYTYGDPIIEEFTVTSVTPANGSTLESIDAIAITFSNGMKPDILPITCGEKSYTFVNVSDVYVPVDIDMNYEPIVISEPGTYTLDLSELEGLTGDKVFTWTIEEAVVAPTLNETAVFDFTNNAWGIEGLDPVSYAGTKTAGDYTDGTNTIHIDPTANNGQFYYENGYLRIQKPGSKIILPAFDFAVEKIEVVGHPSATGYANVDMNVYVGDAAVSTACIGSTDTYTYEIAADNQAAGNVYELVIGSNGGNYSSIMYITYIKVYPAENKLEAPVIDLASGVYVGEQTVNAHSATTDIEGVTNVTYYYTTDGNEPTTEDEESVDGVITITNSCTLKVVVEFTLGEKTYVSASTSAEYIITEAATYHRAVAVEAGNYFLVADGYVSAPIEGTTLPAVEVTVDGNDVTAPVYYAITLEEAAGGYYIKDVNGKYIYNTMMNPGKLSSGTYAPMDAWTIEIADDENSTATIKCNGYVLALNKGVFCTVQLGGTDVPVMPTLYGTYATGINEAVVNGEAIESIYDLTGRRVEKITKSGIYIVNGKKVLVK